MFVPRLVIDLVSFVHVSRISRCFMESSRLEAQYLATMPRRLWYTAKNEADQAFVDRRVERCLQRRIERRIEDALGSASKC